MTSSTRAALTLVASALLAAGGLTAGTTDTPPARAADFYGSGPAECPAALAARDTGLGFVTALGTRRDYWTDIDLGSEAASAAWIRAPRTTHRILQHTFPSSSGYMVLTRSGSAFFVRQADNGMLLSKTRIRGPWSGLRAVTGAAPTGRPDSASTKTTVLYGITTSGQLVRMPVTWNAKGVPGVGARQALGRGYTDYVALRFSGYTHDAHTPESDHLVGITRSGRFNRVEVTREKKPTATVTIMARSGFAGATDFVTDQCWQDGNADAWIVRHRGGGLTRYVDPDVTDTSLRGLKRTTLRGGLPTGMRLL